MRIKVGRRRALTENERQARQIAWRVTGAVAFLLALLIGVVYVNGTRRDHAQTEKIKTNTENNQVLAACTQRWASAVTDRNKLIAARSNARLDALDTLVSAVIRSKDPVYRQKALNAYLAASAAQKTANTEHPIPPDPVLYCHLHPIPGVKNPPTTSPSSPSPTHQSIRTPTTGSRTVVVTQTSVVPGPTQTVSTARTVPGPTVTAYSTRVVPGPTRTVTKTRYVPGPIITICIGPLGLPCR